jgi:hypothetical protein
MSAPPKDISGPTYMGDMVDVLTSFAGRDVVLDRSHYGELVWPGVYGRQSLLTVDDIEILREIEESLGVERILMHDPNTEAHWQRCVDNKEPLTKIQFVKARTLYSSLADKYNFIKKTLKDFPDAVQMSNDKDHTDNHTAKNLISSSVAVQAETDKNKGLIKTGEQLKLEKANIINEVLSKRILKNKGLLYDELENNIRQFLNVELQKIFGNGIASGFSNEEVQLLKFFCKRLKDKESTR